MKDIGSQTCRQTIAEIAHAFQERSLSSLSPTTYQHLSGCSRCRAGLLVLVRGFDPEPNRSATSRDCEACQADLPAFIDLEAEDPAQAAAAYPHVWWHLWTCQTCSQTYEFTHILLDAQRSGEIPPLRLPHQMAQRAVPIARRVRLTRQALAFALPHRPSMVSVPRGEDDRYVLFDDIEDEPEHRQFTVAVQEKTDGFWQMVVTAIPPPDGLLVLIVGTLRLVAPFDPSGIASLSGIPQEVFILPDGPDLEISIVPDQGTSGKR
jgi:hypothetical protein